MLSHRTFAGPSIDTPICFNLYRRLVIDSKQALRPTNSLENVLASAVFYFLLYHMIGTQLRNIINPV